MLLRDRTALAPAAGAADIMRKSSGFATNMIVDFIRECTTQHNVTFHAPIIFGLRESGMRGVFLSDNHNVERNMPILSFPLRAALTVDNTLLRATQLERSLPTMQRVRDILAKNQLEALGDHVLLSIAIALRIHQLPRSSRIDVDSLTKEEFEGFALAMGHPVTPWARMIDQEDWDDGYVGSAYKSLLDTWQQQNYNELLTGFRLAMSRLHSELELPMPIPLLLRVTRTVIARVDQVPLYEDLQRSNWSRRLTSWRHRFLGAPALSDRRRVALLPMIDMLNHSNRPNSLLRITATDKQGGVEPTVNLVSTCRIRGGSEICRHYNFNMDRGNALFRYGFLPFSVVGVEKLDPWKEHYSRGVAPNLGAEPQHIVEERRKVDDEVQRLQRLFRKEREGVN